MMLMRNELQYLIKIIEYFKNKNKNNKGEL